MSTGEKALTRNMSLFYLNWSITFCKLTYISKKLTRLSYAVTFIVL